MAKTEAEIRERKEKKDKKRKREEAGAADGEDGVVAKKEKKDKKEKKRKSLEPQAAADGDVSMAIDDDDEEAQVATGEVPRAALVPFAHPLADEKTQKKVLKVVKKAAKNKAIKRGVKECVKSIRKSSAGDPASLVDANKTPASIVVVAADISPMDVISHIPVLCEDHNIPYIFVPSRSELGIAGATKRPTSIIAITSKPGNLKGATADPDWDEQYKDLHKIVLKAGATSRT